MNTKHKYFKKDCYIGPKYIDSSDAYIKLDI